MELIAIPGRELVFTGSLRNGVNTPGSLAGFLRTLLAGGASKRVTAPDGSQRLPPKGIASISARVYKAALNSAQKRRRNEYRTD